MPDPYPIPLPSDRSFDPQWLIAALEEQQPDETELIDAARLCLQFVAGDSLYLYFVSPVHPNEPGSEWQHDRSVVVERSKYGEIVIDVLKSGRIGGIEFLHNVFAADREGRLK